MSSPGSAFWFAHQTHRCHGITVLLWPLCALCFGVGGEMASSSDEEWLALGLGLSLSLLGLGGIVLDGTFCAKVLVKQALP